MNNLRVSVIPAEARIQKHIEKTGFPPAREWQKWAFTPNDSIPLY